MASLLYLKNSLNLSDEELVARWAENVQWQFFSGINYCEPQLPCDATQIGRFRRLLGEDGLQDTGRSPKQVIVDLGYRGVDADNPGVQIIHRGKYKSLSEHEKKLLKRRQAIKPLIGHTKADHRMDRCWLHGEIGDALQALSCAAGYNIRWLLRAIACLGLGGLFAPCLR